jgi:hypothetical protein
MDQDVGHGARQMEKPRTRRSHPQIPIPVPVVGQAFVEAAQFLMQAGAIAQGGNKNGVVMLE